MMQAALTIEAIQPICSLATPICSANPTKTKEEEPDTVPKILRRPRFQLSDDRVRRVWGLVNPVGWRVVVEAERGWLESMSALRSAKPSGER